jgi:hypothetical protein
MLYPEALCPIDIEEIKLISGKLIRLPKATPFFHRWHGDPPKSTYGGKPIISIDGSPSYAELAILRLLKTEGWNGVWIDTFRKVKRTGIDSYINLPNVQEQILNKIYEIASTKSGCFDVFCWKQDGLLFAEAKRKGHDRIRPTQIKWLSAAIEYGISIDSLLVVEWKIGD